MPEGDIASAKQNIDAAVAHQPPEPPNEPARPVTPVLTNGDHSKTENNGRTGDSKINEEAPGDTVSAESSRKRKYDAISKLTNGPRNNSPPWKKFAAEGPTSFVEDGKRKSARTNTLPLELQPPSGHRRTRAVTNRSKAQPSYAALRNGLARGSRSAVSAPTVKNHAAVKPAAEFKIPAIKPTRQSQRSVSIPNSPSSRRRSSVAMDKDTVSPQVTPPKTTRRGRPPSRPSHGETSAQSNDVVNGIIKRSPPMEVSTPLKFQRLRLRVRDPVMPKIHPAHFPLPRKFGSFADWVQHDDPLEGEEKERLSDEQAKREAAVRLRILGAAQPGGPLSAGRCTKYIPREWQEPQARYGHGQYMAAHAIRFQKLLVGERERHRKQAKQLAVACQNVVQTVARWSFLREAKTEEQIEQEIRQFWKARKKEVIGDLEIAWSLVRHEVSQIKMKMWEEEQEALGKQALDEMFDNAKAILQQHSAAGSPMALSETGDTEDFESEITSEAQESHVDYDMVSAGNVSDRDEFSSDLDDENMSDSSDEDEADGAADEDEDLSADALQAKYAHILTQGNTSPRDADLDKHSGDSEEELEDADESDDNADDSQHAATQLEAVKPIVNSIVEHAGKVATADESTYQDAENIVGEVDQDYPGTDADTHNYDSPALEEVDDALLESDDESTDMSSDMGTEEDEADSDEGSDSGSDEDSYGMLGFLSHKDMEALKHSQANEQSARAGGEIGHSTLDINGTEAEENTPQSEQAASEEPATQSPASLRIDTSFTSATSAELHTPSPRASKSSSIPQSPTSHTTPTTPNIPQRVDIPTQLLRGTLREYQHDGLDWLAKLYAGGRNGILADEMGLGKTIQTIALLAHLAVHYEVWGPHLVVVPTSVILNWEMEFKKWCPGFKILTYYGTQDERKKKRQGWLNDDMWNVCITSYQLIIQDAAAFKKRSWHFLILDEAHNIKNFQTQRWQTLLTFKTHSRLLLTGTPLQNNLQELWSLLYFLMPAGTDGAGGFADLEKFLNSMKRPADQILDQGRQKLDAEAQARVNKLHEVLRPYLLRRLKSEVEKQMPGKYEHIVYCRLSKRQRQLYDEFMGRADTKRTLTSGNYMSIINCLMSLRKVCNHPDLFETRQIVTSFAMPRSAVANYEIKELLVRRRLLAEEKLDLDFCGLVPTSYEWNTRRRATRNHELQPARQLHGLVERQTRRLKPIPSDCSTIDSCLSRMKAEAELNVVRQLQNRVAHVNRTIQRWPINGADLVRMLTMPDRFQPNFPTLSQQRTEGLRKSCTPGQWYLNSHKTLRDMMPTLPEVAARSDVLVQKFSCVTPAVVAEDVLPLALTAAGRDLVLRTNPASTMDPYHEARIRLSIQFPDKRLLQYDCGKLQSLDKLLRELQAGGHRCLIFTQMTKVLDILEQFLNIHGHRYLRLDGATKIEQRQLLTDRFNSDSRILAFILSSRSGGLGINLTGADTVIFYDLDWNPAMDAQCQDRCHRIGQTRDVHIYRFVSEYTIEANILRKSNQKRLLDDVIIQKGEFTTDYFNRVTYRDAFADEDIQGDVEASAAMDRILGDATGLGQAFDAVEDKEDTLAAKVATKEMSHIDDADFNESTQANNTPKTSAPQTPGATGKDAISGLDGAIEQADMENQLLLGDMPHVDEYMLRFIQHELKDVVVVPPAALQQQKKKKQKKGKDWKKGR